VGALLTQTYVALAPEATVENALAVIRNNTFDATDISYLYTTGKDNLLLGVVDLRELVLAAPLTILSELTASPVVSVMTTDQREDLTEIFAKYHFRMVPVVDESDHLLGVVHYNDVMKGLSVRPRI
jgi:magnesium transporter